MRKTKQSTITIIGAGLAGCFLAILLAKRGYTIEVYERNAMQEIIDAASKRSFNLTFYGFGVKALKEAGLWHVVKSVIVPLAGSITQVSQNSKPIFAPVDGKMPFYTVQRPLLVKMLLEYAQRQPLITFHFETAMLSLNRQDKTLLVQNEKTKKCSTVA